MILKQTSSPLTYLIYLGLRLPHYEFCITGLLCGSKEVMRTLPGPAFGSAALRARSEDRSVADRATFDAARPRHTWIIVFWLISILVATPAWLGGLSWAAIWLVGQMLS
jgi:hypothetical protein